MSDQQKQEPTVAPSYTTQAREAAHGAMEKAQHAAQSVKESITGSLQTVKEIVTGHHDNNPSLQQSDQDFTESADTYASPEQRGPGLKDKITQALHSAKETVKEKLGFNQGDNDVDMNRQDRERMDTDYDHTSQSDSRDTTSPEQQQSAPGIREKLHHKKEQMKESLHHAKENVKHKLHMDKDKDTEMSTEKDIPKTKHQEFYGSDPSIGFFDRAYHDQKSVWDLGRPQPNFVLFLAQQNLSGEGSVLEVGCGTGEHIIHMASTGHRRCVGIDISDRAIHEAKLKAHARGVGERVQFKKYDVRHLMELGSTFDIVIDVCFGHTIPVDMRQSYADQLRTVLNPGGVLYTFWYTGKNSYKVQDIYQNEDEKDVEMSTESNKKKTTTTSKSDDTVIVPEGMTADIVRSIFSTEKGWRVDRVTPSNIELSGGKTWPGMMIAMTFIGPKHPASIPVKARDSTGMLQGVPTATGQGALLQEKEKEKMQQQQEHPAAKQGALQEKEKEKIQGQEHPAAKQPKQ